MSKGLNIGDYVYAAIYDCLGYKVFGYKVYEVRQTEDSKLYAIECQNCCDHNNCKLLIAPNNRKNETYYKFVEMINNYDKEEFGCNESCWHENAKFFTDKQSGLIEKVKNNIELIKDRIRSEEKELKELNYRLNSEQETLDLLEKGQKE